MRRLVVATVALLFMVMILAGCSSSSSTDAASGTTPAPGQPAAPSATPAAQPAPQPGAAVPPGQPVAQGAAAGSTSEPKPEVPRDFETSDDTPLFFTEALKQKKPILVVYYNSDEAVSKLVVAEVAKAYKLYEKTAILLMFEANKNEDVAALARQLQVDFIPYVAAIDRHGTIVFERTGYQDSKVVEMALYKASTK